MKATPTLFILLLCSSLAQAGELNVVGQCQKEVTPDRVSVTLTSRALEKEPKIASAKASAQYEKLRTEVKKLNLKDSRTNTSGFTVNQEWDYTANKRVLRGYSASVSLTAETSEVTRAGEILDIAAKLNVEEVGTPSTFLSIPLAKEEYQSCLEVAIQNAKEKAIKMAAAAGVKLGKLSKLSEFKEQVHLIPLARKEMQMADTMASNAQASFESAPSTVEVTVHAVYEIK